MEENNKKLENIARKLQEKIMEDIRRKYSPTVIDYWQNPRNFKKIENPDGYGQLTGSCGDTMEVSIKVKNEKIEEAGFVTDGCGTTIVCGGVATEMTKGKTILEALATVSERKILQFLGGLPPADQHCAQLAAASMRRAIADYLYQRKEPWRKIYRNR